jgi:GH15 family glucan-1,4-alpha-glucosidase
VVIRSALAVAVVVIASASFSGAAERRPEPIPVAVPAPRAEPPAEGAFSRARLGAATRLGLGAPPWARSLYVRSLQVLFALTDPDSGAMIAGEREGWDYVWPRDAATGAMALEAAALHHESRRVTGFLDGLDLDAARFYPDGDSVPGRPPAGDADGWVEAARRTVSGTAPAASRQALQWGDRQDYGENATGDLLGNAIASGAPAAEINGLFLTPRGLVREQGSDALDASAAWAVVPFTDPALLAAARRTLLALARESTRFGIPPMEGWTPGEVWTAPTAWSAWALVELGERPAADRLLAELRRAATPAGTLPERVDAGTGEPTSTTPLAWSHAFAILALRARYPGARRSGAPVRSG